MPKSKRERTSRRLLQKVWFEGWLAPEQVDLKAILRQYSDLEVALCNEGFPQQAI